MVKSAGNFDSEDGMDEVQLIQNARDREQYDEKANLYAIILATEHLERAFARDAIGHKEYHSQCHKLISQFRVAERVVLGGALTAKEFMTKYNMDCKRAEERLLKMGVPESVRGSNDDAHVVTVADAVSHFITAMDAVKLDMRATDELQPLLSDLMAALERLPETPNDFEPNRKVRFWLEKLNALRASDEIDDDDSRQLHLDLDSAYSEFNRYLRRK